MSDNKTTYFTKKGLKELKEKLLHLEQEERPNASKKVAEARAKGDLKENAEYHAAREALAWIETYIARFKEKLAHAQVIKEEAINTDQVAILSKVSVKREGSEAPMVFHMVSPQEVDLKAGKISIDSPIGHGLLGKKRGETVVVESPGGSIVFKILDIFV